MFLEGKKRKGNRTILEILINADEIRGVGDEKNLTKKL